MLIDIIGIFNSGGTNFAKDITLRRKNTITSPNTTFDKTNEWDSFTKDTVDDIGKHTTATANVNEEKLKALNIFPNPITNSKIFISNPLQVKIKSISLFSVIGKKVFQTNNIKSTINFNKIKSGVYLLKIESDLGNTVKKMIIKAYRYKR